MYIIFLFADDQISHVATGHSIIYLFSNLFPDFTEITKNTIFIGIIRSKELFNSSNAHFVNEQRLRDRKNWKNLHFWEIEDLQSLWESGIL